MIVSDSIKEKIIIVAEHDEVSSRKIVLALETNGFKEIRAVNDGEKIYEVLRPYHSQPERVGLIVLNAALPHCQVLELCCSLSRAADGSEIPFLILETFDSDSSGRRFKDDNSAYADCLCYKINAPVNPAELILAVHFLLSMKQERLLRHQQEERLINELAAKSIIDAKLKFLVAHDELTGLFNRNSFERHLRLIVNRNNKLQKHGVLLFVDVDRFSLINELEGFEVGDRLLVELAVLIRKLLPAETLFARIGADEFCLFLENKTKHQARDIAENIKNSVDNFRCFSGETCYSASVSIGIASFENNMPVAHPGEMILHARQACHFAKANGRERVWVYNNEDSGYQGAPSRYLLGAADSQGLARK